MRFSVTMNLSSFFCILLYACVCMAQTRIDKESRRARPPKWDPEVVTRVFFSDAFRDALRGSRPASLSGDARQTTGSMIRGTVIRDNPDTDDVQPAGNWSGIISAETIEDEVKSLKLAIDAAVTTSQRFASDGYLAAADHFGMLAFLFSVVAEYDGEVRWKRDAAKARGLFSHAASICKVGTNPVFRVANERKADLQDLVGGSRLQGVTTKEISNWDDVVDRRPLMRRLELSHQDRLTRWTANARDFSESNQKLIHEAEIVAAIAHALTREGMVDGDEDEYARFCERLQESAARVIEAARAKDAEAGQKATGEMSKSCSECHELYRD